MTHDTIDLRDLVDAPIDAREGEEHIDPAVIAAEAVRKSLCADTEQALGAPRQAAGLTIIIETGASAKVLNPPPIDVTPDVDLVTPNNLTPHFRSYPRAFAF